MTANATETIGAPERWRLPAARSRVMKRTCSLASLKAPVKWVVTVSAPGFVTPRSDMHMCSASIITATPRGRSTSSMAVATCEVMCSCVCRRLA